MKTIGEIIHHNKNPVYILDDNRDVLYYENSLGFWIKRKFNSKGLTIYSETSGGLIIDYTNENNRTDYPSEGFPFGTPRLK